ncbi:unnamed protein product [Hymenolepis diminuta]|uniref:Uncharacterized protein n=1 Tax=Hymenolepis diminuta TaxID=6216 RepID=A0A564XV45_HYMDI|nr:unnamed protein product [Hymenolepis diminuta]
MASSSMPSYSTEAKEQSIEYGSEVEIELQLPERECKNIFTFQDKLVFIGAWRNENNYGSRRVDLMDISLGQVSSLSDMINVISSSVGVGTEDEILSIAIVSVGLKRVKELLPPCRWSLLPPMIEDRSYCATVNIPDSGILFIGGIGTNGSPLCSTELLMRRSAEVGSGEGERAFVVGCCGNIQKMEMLDFAADGQWTTLKVSCLPLKIESVAIVGNELFVSVELHGDLRVSSLEAGPCSLLSIWWFYIFSLSLLS